MSRSRQRRRPAAGKKSSPIEPSTPRFSELGIKKVEPRLTVSPEPKPAFGTKRVFLGPPIRDEPGTPAEAFLDHEDYFECPGFERRYPIHFFDPPWLPEIEPPPKHLIHACPVCRFRWLRRGEYCLSCDRSG